MSLVVAACGGPVVDQQPAETVASPPGFPVTVQNCGRQLTFDKPPTRAITGFQNTIELMLALGLEDSIVGRQGFPKSPLLPEQEAAFNAIPELSSGKDGFQTSKKEVTLSLRPDFFFAGGSYNVNGAQGLATEKDLEANGAKVFYMVCTAHGSSNALGEADSRPTIEVVYSRIDDIGKIFGVPGRASALVATMKADIAAVQQRIQGRLAPRVFVTYASKDSGPLPGQSDRYFDVGLAGGKNMLGADQPEYPEVSREAVADFNPEVILTANGAVGPLGPDAAQKEALLRQVLPNAPAVKNNRIVGMESIDFTPGVRNVRAVRQAAEAFFAEAEEALLEAPARSSEVTRVPLHYQQAALMATSTPFSMSLLVDDPRFLDAAGALLGRPVLPMPAIATRQTGDTGWHTDYPSSRSLTRLAFMHYFEPLTFSTGALRFLPATHLLPSFDAFDRYMRDHCPESANVIDHIGGQSVETRPGDVIAFDSRVLHASRGGRTRLRWCLEYWVEPATPEEITDHRDSLPEYAPIVAHPAGRRYPLYTNWAANHLTTPSVRR